jgi:hypothetical protein
MRRPRPEAALVDWVDVSFIGFILFVVGALFTAHAVQHGNDPPTDTMLTGIVLILIGLVRSLFCRECPCPRTTPGGRRWAVSDGCCSAARNKRTPLGRS